MRNVLLILALISICTISSNYAFSQEVGLITYQELAQIVIDNSISQNVTASITLQSTNIQEIKIPAEFEQEIRENKRIQAVSLTNEEQCVLGVVKESCIIINVERNPEVRGIFAIQDETKEIAEQYIEKINKIFDTNAKFHSVYVHTNDESNVALETSGVVSGKGVISAVYTMPMEDTDSMYEKISAILIPKTIREADGFYNIAKNLSFEDNSKMTFTLIPSDSKSLLQLKLAVNYPKKASEIIQISPLDYFKIEKINRSNYFSTGAYPLNSIIQVVVLSPENTNVSNVKGNIVPTQIIEEEKFPTKEGIEKGGWFFDPQEGQRIQGVYFFGEESSINKEDLKFSLGGNELQSKKTESNEEIIVVAIITIVAIGAAIFYLKGYRK